MNFFYYHPFLRSNIAVLACTLYLCIPLKAQDVAFLHPYVMPLLLNPAYTGSEQNMRVGATYQHQFLSAEPGMACAIAADYYFNEAKSGVGISAVTDVQGGAMLAHSAVGASYAYNLQLAQQAYVRVGLQALADIFSTSAQRFTFPDNINFDGSTIAGGSPYASEQRVGFDMALGGLLSYRNAFAGVAVHHLLGKPGGEVAGQSIDAPAALTLHGGVNICLSSAYAKNLCYLAPVAMATFQSNYSLVSAGANVFYRIFSVVAYYQKVLNGASIFIVGAAYSSDKFMLSYHFGYGIADKNPAFSSDIHSVAILIKVKYSTPHTYRYGRSFESKNYNIPRF